MTFDNKQLILDHALEGFPKEICGLLCVENGKEVYRRCKNLSKKNNQFVMDPNDYAAACEAGTITHIVHSHCNESPKPSQADLVACEASNLPWIIVSVPTKTWMAFSPKGYKAPLIGRHYSYGVLDCYTLIRDWYKEELKIDLLDFTREEEGWWKTGGNMYMENIAKAGFEIVPQGAQLEKGDIIIMQIGKALVPNHAGVYLGGNKMLHHLRTQLSCRDVYDGWYLKHTRCVIRRIK